MTTEAIAPTTSAATHSFAVYVDRPVSVKVAGFSSGSETVPIKELLGGSYVNHKTKDGTDVALTKDWTSVIIDAPGTYKIDKPSTSESVGVYIS